MASTPERKVKDKVIAQLVALKAYYFYPVTGGYGSSGVPDIVGCVDGIFFGIECKAGKNKPTTLQMSNLRRIRETGGVALIINEANVDKTAAFILNKISNLENPNATD
jgi:Holliday junction resolvase